MKIWSKSGNFRSNIASTGVAAYDACWGPDDDQVLYTNNDQLMIKTVQASRKNLQWKAHDGVATRLNLGLEQKWWVGEVVGWGW